MYKLYCSGSIVVDELIGNLQSIHYLMLYD